ncbi:MAG: DUF3179 domain-containing (seleno)protein [Isosphaeraceae bacterium]
MFASALMITCLAVNPDGDASSRAFFQPELFQTLINPACSHCVDEARRKAGELREDDRVLAWIRGKYDGGAIPYRWFLVPYRVISDTYGVFVHDPDAGFVRGYPASLDYRFHGWRNGVMVMRHVDGTLFDCLTGEAFDGPRKGERLQAIPTLETDWGPWLKSSPGTVAYQMIAKFQPQPRPTALSEQSKRTRPTADPRLDPEERVFGIELNGASVAWPVKGFGAEPAVRQVDVNGQSVLIFWDGRTGTAAAYAPSTDANAGRTLSIHVDSSNPEAPWVDKETGSRWGITGRAVSGPLKGETLTWLPGVLVKWYAWAASYPKTDLGETAE